MGISHMTARIKRPDCEYDAATLWPVYTKCQCQPRVNARMTLVTQLSLKTPLWSNSICFH